MVPLSKLIGGANSLIGNPNNPYLNSGFGVAMGAANMLEPPTTDELLSELDTLFNKFGVSEFSGLDFRNVTSTWSRAIMMEKGWVNGHSWDKNNGGNTSLSEIGQPPTDNTHSAKAYMYRISPIGIS